MKRKSGSYVVALSPMMADGFDDVVKFAESELRDDVISIDEDSQVVIVSEAGYQRFEKSGKQLPSAVLADLYEFDEELGGETTAVSLTPIGDDIISMPAAESGDDGEDDVESFEPLDEGRAQLDAMREFLKSKAGDAAAGKTHDEQAAAGDAFERPNEAGAPAPKPVAHEPKMPAAPMPEEKLIEKTKPAEQMLAYAEAMTLSEPQLLIPDADDIRAGLKVDIKEADGDQTIMKLMKQQMKMYLDAVLSMIRREKRDVNENDIDAEIAELRREADEIASVREFNGNREALNARIAQFNEHISQLLHAYTDEVDMAVAAAAEDFRARYMAEHPDYTVERINDYVISAYPGIKEAIKLNDATRLSALNALLDDNADADGLKKSVLSAINFVNLSESAGVKLSEMAALAAQDAAAAEAERLAREAQRAPAVHFRDPEAYAPSAGIGVQEEVAEPVILEPAEGIDAVDAVEPEPPAVLDVAEDDGFGEQAELEAAEPEPEPEVEPEPKLADGGVADETIDDTFEGDIDDAVDDAFEADGDEAVDDAFVADGGPIDEPDDDVKINLDDFAVSDEGLDVVDEADFTSSLSIQEPVDEGDEVEGEEMAAAAIEPVKKGGLGKKIALGAAAAALVAGLGFGGWAFLSRGHGTATPSGGQAVEQPAGNQEQGGQNAGGDSAQQAAPQLSDEEKMMRAEMKRLFTSDMELQLSVSGTQAVGRITSFSDDGAVVTLETGEQVTLSWAQLKAYSDAYPELFSSSEQAAIPSTGSNGDAGAEAGTDTEADADAEAGADAQAEGEADAEADAGAEAQGEGEQRG